MNPRAIAALLLTQVIKEKKSLTEVLSNLPKNFPKAPEPAFIKALCYEVLRWYFQLNHLLQPLIPKPLKPKDSDIHILLMIGVCQILYLRIPDYAAVTETVRSAKDLNKSWATQFINGVLRNFLRQKASLLSQCNLFTEAFYAHPDWLIKQIKKAWPSYWESILVANNVHPPLSLRVNLQRTSREQFIKLLSEAHISAIVSKDTSAGLILETPVDVPSLPGFSEGFFSVQDISPQFTPQLLDLHKDFRVLDACAAPGGKTMHILETEPELAECVAVDINEARLEMAKQNWKRLALPDCITWKVCDIELFEETWDQIQFDRIVLDAPCSATGVIRRHPDIKVLREPEDIAQLSAYQLTLLETLWKMLKPGGLLLYATCSILPEENTEVIERFLKDHHDAAEKPIIADWGVTCSVGRQILPGAENMDGFYYARLAKSIL